MGQYLGCMHRPYTRMIDGVTMNGVEYDLQDYLKSKAGKYLDLAEQTAGVRPKLTYAVTLFFPESPPS